MTLKALLIRLDFLLTTLFGINIRIMFRSLRGVPRYVRDYFNFCSSYRGCIEFLPCLNDWYEEGGDTKGEYFWQDLLVARMIFETKPNKHVYIGSRVDGFVAHVASFREIEVIDIRRITTHIPGVTFKQADLMRPADAMKGYCDSLSCLHALEHFGLGRYGDPIDTMGFERGIENMATFLKEKGTFYLSVPIGRDRVEFNANRVFDPNVIVDLAKQNSLRLSGFTVIRQGNVIETLSLDNLKLTSLSNQRYALGIFSFIKTYS